MPYDLSNVLVIGISSRALFDLEYENQIFEDKGLQPFLEYQRHHENDLLKPGTGFHLVKSLLDLNRPGEQRRVEVIVMSRNHPDVYLRVSNSIRNRQLDVSRAILTGGEPLNLYLKAYKIDLFLSAWDDDVASAINHGIAAGLIYNPPATEPDATDHIRIAFDGDCVLFSDEAESINIRQGLAAFHEHERECAAIPLPDGPLAKLIRTIAHMQGSDPQKSPFRIGLVTARNAPSHERAIRTLRDWNVRIDGAAFLGGMAKEPWLRAFHPQIFFDDQETICKTAASVVPTARVPFPAKAVVPSTTMSRANSGDRKNRFLLICKMYLKKEIGQHTEALEQWYSTNLAECDHENATGFLDELETSVKGTPVGQERPAKGSEQQRVYRFVPFLDALMRKHRRTQPPDAETPWN